jgi:hypothetical protein
MTRHSGRKRKVQIPITLAHGGAPSGLPSGHEAPLRATPIPTAAPPPPRRPAGRAQGKGKAVR